MVFWEGFALNALLAVVGEQDAQLAGELLLRYPGHHTELEQAIMRRIRKDDPLAALAWVEEFGDAKRKPQLRRDLLSLLTTESDDHVFAVYDRLIELEGPGMFRKDVRIDDLF